ncbi:MAG: hypothetical protein Q4D62_01345, partial [Planctomycetia bacterium]|nr:hypothetical protein [Planctomycetia bacterium]
LQERLEKGLPTGKKAGQKEGIQEGQRKSLLAVLRTRFGEIPEEVLRKIDSQEKDWGELLTLGITCDTLEEFCGYWK